MTIAEAVEFGFVEKLPKRERSRLGKLIDRFHAFKEVANGRTLLPITVAARLCDVSRQRLWQLIDAGRIEVVEFETYHYVPEESLFAWANSERKTGRPTYVGDMTLKEAVAAVKEHRETRGRK